MSVSGTYLPPKAPKRPAASGRGVEGEWGLDVVLGAAAAAETVADEFDALARIALLGFDLAVRGGEGWAVASTTSDGDDVARRAAIAEGEEEGREKRERMRDEGQAKEREM